MSLSARESSSRDKIPFAVVVPTHQRAASVGRALDSVLAQSHPADQVVVVDDGSTDDTATVLERYGDAIEVVRQPNAGCSAARNRGVATAHAEWIAFLDSDDTWQPGHLADLARAIQDTGGAAALYFTDVRRPATEAAESLWRQSGFAPRTPHQLVPDGAAWVMRARQPMMLQASALRRAALIAAGGLDERLPTREDTHLFLRLGLGHPLCAVAGISVEMGGDAPAQRLTGRHPPDSAVYLEATVRLYRDVLSRCAPSREHARELSRRLAEAHWRRARGALARLRVGRALFDLAGMVRASPVTLLRKVGRGLGLAHVRRPDA